LCGAGLIEADEIGCGICGGCKASIAPVEGERCVVCGKPLVSEIGTCLTCRNNPSHSYERLWVLYPYMGKYRKLLTAYKFNKNLALADFFAEKVAQIITNEPLLKEAVIVPIPIRPGKIKHSGWDQVDYLIKRVIKAAAGRSVNRCLKRKKSKVQKELNRRERLDNLKNKIYMKGSAPKTALLIDDVITTGSTMEICAQTLKANGAQKVYGICLCYD